MLPSPPNLLNILNFHQWNISMGEDAIKKISQRMYKDLYIYIFDFQYSVVAIGL